MAESPDRERAALLDRLRLIAAGNLEPNQPYQADQSDRRPSAPSSLPPRPRAGGQASELPSIQPSERSAERSSGRSDDPGPGSVVEAAEPDPLDQAVLERVRHLALDRLTGRSHSRGELTRWLLGRGCPEPAVTAVLDRLAAVGLIDDVAFARDWVDQRRLRKGLSRVQLTRELSAKGVSAEIVEQTLGERAESDQAVALELARARLSRLAGLERPVWERRLAGLLARRGFSPAVVRGVVFQLGQEAGRSASEPPDDDYDGLG